MCRVLIAEEGSRLREALEKIVESNEGFQVIRTVSNSEDLIAECRKQDRIDILFMDAYFKGQSSISVGREIRRMDPDIKIFVISAVNNDPKMKEFIKIGIEDYINLPITFSKIRSGLKAYRKKHQIFFDEGMMNKVTDMIAEKNYVSVYPCACDVVNHAASADSENFGGSILEIVKGVDHQINVLSGKKPNLLEKFPIEDVLSQKTIYWKLWLSSVMGFTLEFLAVDQCEALSKVFESIENNMSEPIRLDDLCRKCNISEGYLNKKMRESMGVSTMDYIQRRKLLEAKKRLSFQTESIGDIAYELGYYESSYFSKVFKKYEGISPIQFRKNVGGKIE